MSFRLHVADGRFARNLESHGPELTVGTAARSGLRLESPGVAAHHATVRQFGSRLAFECRGSRARVGVRGRLVRRAVVAAGEEVRVGDARLRVAAVEPAVLPAGAQPERPPRRRRARVARAVIASLAVHGAALVAFQGAVLVAGAVHAPRAHIDVDAIERPFEISDAPETVPVAEPDSIVERPRDPVEIEPPETELPDEPLAASDPRFRQPPPAPRVAEPPPEPAAPVIGLGAGPSAVPDLGARTFGKDGAATANRTAAGLLESDAAGAALLRGIRGRATKATVWVIRGDYDQAERMLQEFSVGHELKGKDALETHEIPAALRVLVFNCTGRPLSTDAQRRVAWWVWEGGWLVTTDWGVERVLERGIPGSLTPLRENERPVLTKDETVSVRPTTDRGFDAGVPQEPGALWWLEDSSVPFTIAPGIGAEVLVRSDDLERRHGRDASGVAVTFPYGKGRVLHLLGHVWQQEGNVRGTILVHRVTLNFLAAALAR